MDVPNKEEVFERVKTCLVEALDVDEEDVTLEASLTEDLEAESIDFVDIVIPAGKGFRTEDSSGRALSTRCILEQRVRQRRKTHRCRRQSHSRTVSISPVA